MAKLHFKYAAMNAGKSIDLMRSAHNYEENGYNVVVLKSALDTKANNYLLSRIGLKREVDYLLQYSDSVLNVLEHKLVNVNCILVDEAQFLSATQVDELYIISKTLDIPVLCYGLRTNFKMESFEGSKRLLELADKLEKIITLCECGKPARFNAREINGKYIIDGEEIVIDGNNEVEYVPLCGKCFIKKVKKINLNKIKDKLI